MSDAKPLYLKWQLYVCLQKKECIFALNTFKKHSMLIRNQHIQYGFANTRFGNCFIATVGDKVCQLSFFGNPADGMEAFSRRFKHNTLTENNPHAQQLADAIFEQAYFPELYLEGTSFQQKVWKALLEIPAGTCSTYARIAMETDHPKAVRAVGTAVGANPIAYLIPCHRVIRTDGGLGGYRWGLDIKKKILAFESK